jgi:hypothetical protein
MKCDTALVAETRTLGWATFVLMGAAAVGLAVTWKYT